VPGQRGGSDIAVYARSTRTGRSRIRPANPTAMSASGRNVDLLKPLGHATEQHGRTGSSDLITRRSRVQIPPPIGFACDARTRRGETLACGGKPKSNVLRRRLAEPGGDRQRHRAARQPEAVHDDHRQTRQGEPVEEPDGVTRRRRARESAATRRPRRGGRGSGAPGGGWRASPPPRRRWPRRQGSPR
jgi:hypothetical protein